MACEQCNGTGWLHTEQGVKDCECKRVQILEWRIRKAGLPERYQQANFEVFRTEGMSVDVRNAALMMRRFVEEYPEKTSRGVLMTGPCGTGKTHLAIAAVRELTLRYAANVTFADVRILLKSLQSTYSNANSASEADVLKPILNNDVCVLDELGAARVTDWSADIVEHIINTRYNKELCTIITTNLPNSGPSSRFSASGDTGGSYASSRASLPATETLGDRIGARMFSRIQEMCMVLPVNGDDYRTRPKR